MSHPLYRTVQQIAKVRAEQPALRYGRQYFRQVSGNRTEFGISSFPSGVLSFSRILNDEEVVVVAATNTIQGFQGEVIVDHELNPEGTLYKVLYSNKKGTGGAGEFGWKITASEILCPDNSSCASLNFTRKDTIGELVSQAQIRNTLFFLASSMDDFANSIRKDKEPKWIKQKLRNSSICLA